MLALLKAKGDAAPAGTQVVVGFSSERTSASRTVLRPPIRRRTRVGIAAITDDDAGNNIGLGYTGTAPNLVPATTFYNNAVFGRNVYNVVPTAKIDSAFGNVGLKSMFKDPDGAGPLRAAICNETATISAGSDSSSRTRAATRPSRAATSAARSTHDRHHTFERPDNPCIPSSSA